MESSKKITSNLIWRFLERFGAQGVTLVVSIVLARLLDPNVYGVIALITVITTVLQVFVDSGLGTALIQKKDADDLDFSSVFYFNLVVCISLYVALFSFSPIIAKFYKIPELSSTIRVLGLLLIISGFKNIQGAYVSRNLLFKKYFFATLGGTVSAAFVGIGMAYMGFGVWALVAQNLVNQTIDTIILWISVKWRPKKQFSLVRLKALFSYGWKLLVSSLLDTIWSELRQLIVGKMYSTSDLAYYNKGNEYPKYATTALNNSIDSVLLPVMSKEQDNPQRVKEMTRKAIKTSSYIMWPMMMGLAACSKSFVCLILTEKWEPAVPYFIIFCIVYAFYPIHTANLNAIKALGRSDLFLKLEIIKKIVNLALILSTMWFGVFWLAFGSIIGSVFSQLINSWPNRKLLNYKYEEQIKDIFPYIILSIVMAMAVYSVSLFKLSYAATLCIQIPLGIMIYWSVSAILKLEPYTFCKSVLLSIIGSRRK